MMFVATDDCQDGTELRSNGSCMACKVGTFRKQGVNAVCTICPDSGKTTRSTGAVSSDECSLSEFCFESLIFYLTRSSLSTSTPSNTLGQKISVAVHIHH